MNKIGDNQPNKKSHNRLGVAKTLKEEFARNIPEEFLKQIKALPSTQKKETSAEQEIQPGESLSLLSREQKQAKEQKFHRRLQTQEINLRIREKQETKQQIENIRQEIASLTKEVRHLGRQADEIVMSVDATPAKPEKYYYHLFKLFLAFLKDLRQKIAEGNTWLTAFKQRSKKKNYFRQQVKKSGTKFSLSSERTPVTQTN